jgi:hypothetical protein
MAATTKGLQAVDLFMRRLAESIDRIAVDDTEQGAKDILDASKRITPRESGRLANDTEVVKTSATRVEVRYNADYALHVHEDLEARHKTGQAKFLEVATNEQGPKIARQIAKDIAKIRR